MARSTKATAPDVDELVDATAEPAEPAPVDQVDERQADDVDDEPAAPEDVTGRTIWPGSL